MGDDRDIEVGWAGAGANLKAVGTADKHIVLTSHNNPGAKGDWKGLMLYHTGAQTALEYVDISYAGSKEDGAAVRTSGTSRGHMKNCSVSHAPNGGVAISSDRFTSEGTTFDDVDGKQEVKSQ